MSEPSSACPYPAPVVPPAASDRVASTRPAVCDSDIPTLAAVLDSVELGKQIGLLPASQWSWGVPHEVRVEVLKRQGALNCTLKIVVRTESGWHPLMGKVYADEKRGLRVHHVMEALWRAGFTREAEFSIPQPIAYLPSLRLLLQEKVEGLEVKDIFKYGDQRLRAVAAERCARWLARFHALAPLPGRTSDLEKMLARSERAWRLVSEPGGALASKSAKLFERLRVATVNLGAVPMCAGHGDFAPYNVIFARERTVTFDFDLHDRADPARDVARFLIPLERLARRGLRSAGAQEGTARIFLDAYLASGGQRVEDQLPLHRAAACLRRAERAVKAGAFEWRERTEAILDEGLRTLERPVGKGNGWLCSDGEN